MTEFLRNNRYASVIITTVLLVMVGIGVSVTRSDKPNSSVVLRADEQQLQAGVTTSTLPPAVAPTFVGGAPVPTLAPVRLGTIPNPPRRPAPGISPRPTTAPNTGGGNNTGTTATTSSSGGGGPTTIYNKPPGNAFAAGRIAFSAQGGVWTVNPDGSDARAVASDAYFPAWAKDHSAIAVSDADNPGGALSLLTPTDRIGLTTGVVDDAQPTWSPDGSRLAFARIDNTADDDYSAIWIVNRDGSNLRKVATPSPCFSRDPAWSPDGTKIAFWSSREHCGDGQGAGTFTLYVYDLVNNETSTLGDAETNRAAPAWSPDGKKLAFASDGDGGVGFEICVMNSNGTGVTRLTNVSGDDVDPSWSPDGKKLVFRSDRNGGGIFIMNADGSSPTMLVGGATHPSWG